MPIRRRFKIEFEDSPQPQTSPWGQVQTAILLGKGMWRVHTPGHGGIQLSTQRNKVVPYYLRNRAGWYEEDIEVAIVYTSFPDEFERYLEEAKKTLMGYYPDEYERLYEVKLEPGQSHRRDEKLWAETVTDKYVAMSAFDDWANFVPDGMVGIFAKLGGYEEQRKKTIDPELDPGKWFLVPKSDYDKRGPFGFVFEPGQHYTEIQKPDAHGRASKSAKETVAATSTVKVVKIELVVSYEPEQNGNPAKWDWAELLDVTGAQCLSVTDI